jgi:hypothetical protein
MTKEFDQQKAANRTVPTLFFIFFYLKGMIRVYIIEKRFFWPDSDPQQPVKLSIINIKIQL